MKRKIEASKINVNEQDGVSDIAFRYIHLNMRFQVRVSLSYIIFVDEQMCC